MYDRSVEKVTGFVLAGGKSSRMGADKALLELGGQTLLARALDVAAQVTRQVRLVGNRNRFAAFGTLIEDVYPECGPLGGIHAALMSTATELNLMLAVDLPFIGPDFLRYLILKAGGANQAGGANAVVTLPRSGGFLQPLCAVYRKEFGEAAENSLRAGKNKIGPLLDKVKTRVIEPDELTQAGFTMEVFRNLNTPAEWEAARREFEKKKLD
jgi:molybdopterin-guanine dinucleotide biosynthesis protein A